jgi:hypothetical protein
MNSENMRAEEEVHKKCIKNKCKLQASEDVKIHNKHHRRERSVERSDTIRHTMKTKNNKIKKNSFKSLFVIIQQLENPLLHGIMFRSFLTPGYDVTESVTLPGTACRSAGHILP